MYRLNWILAAIEIQNYLPNNKLNDKNIVQFIGTDLSEFDDDYRYPIIGKVDV